MRRLVVDPRRRHARSASQRPTAPATLNLVLSGETRPRVLPRWSRQALTCSALATKPLRNKIVATNLGAMECNRQPDSNRLTLTLGAPVRGVNMFGREREVSTLWQRLHRDHLLLLAPRRVGKTSVM